MKDHTRESDKKRLRESIDALTEENRRHIPGVLEALKFAQTEQGKVKKKESCEKSPVYPV